ncbi:unnamed protein product [Scytosiphon promiscuus]
MDTLTTTSVSTVTRGVAMQWKPRLNVELGSFVYPSLMLESTQRLEADGWAHDTGGGNSKRLVTGKSVRGLHKLGRQPTRKGKDMSGSGNRLGLEGDGGHLEEEKSRSRLGRTRADSDTTAVPPPLTWILNVEPEQVRKRPTSGVLTLKFSQPLLPGAALGADGSTTLEMERESSCSGSIVTAQGTRHGWRVAARRWGGTGDDFTSLSSKWSSCSFEECLKAGEEKLREEIHRLHDELNEPSGDGTKNLTGTGVLAAQARSIMANDKTRKIAAAMSTKGRASAVQYQKLLSRPSANWTNVGRIVSKITPLGLRDIKNRDKLEMRAELKRLEKERHDEEDRRIAHDFEEQRIRAKMANSRLKQLVSVEDKARKMLLLAKESYFAQFQQAARTRYGGHFDGGSSGGTGIGAMAPRPVIGSRGGGRPKGTASGRGGSVSSAGSSRGSVMYQAKPGPVMVPQASDGSKRQAMAREVFIVACLELGLHPDLSQVRWNLGTIDLSHFGLGDRLAEALAASLKHSPPESLCLRDNRMTDSPLRVIISALDVDSLVKLDLSENRVGPGAMKTLCSFEGFKAEDTLVLRATNLGDAEVAPLCETLGGNDMLLSLNLSRNNLRSAGASSLAKMLSSPSCGLQELDISWNCCSGKGTVELGEALKHQCTLRKLEVAFNSFSDDGTMALAIALLDNRQLTSLGFSWNRIGGRASLALSRMLCLNSTLRKLDLSGNPLTETGGRSILRALLGGSACDVGMRGCSFLEDNSLLFDRNYPPPLISMDLDLKNAFQCCVLHELIGLAQAKPGSKFVEVYRHSGGGRGRTPITLQVVEDLKGGTRRAAVIDSGTGELWTPPDSGWISIKFKASRELPSIKASGRRTDVLNPEAAWTAMMLIMGQESDSDRMNVLRLVLRDTYVTTESGQKLIDQLTNTGNVLSEVLAQVWTRVVDANNLYGFLSHNVEYSARRDVVNILTHERFKFNWDNPTATHHSSVHRPKIPPPVRKVLVTCSPSRAYPLQRQKGFEPRSPGAQNWSNFRNARIDKEPVELTEASATNLPVSGVLEFDYVSTAKAPPDSVPATDAQVQALQESLHLLPRRIFGDKPNYMLAVLQLQQAAARYYFTTPQASALAALFGRTWDLENFDAVLATLPAGVDKQAASRLGFLNVLNPLKIARHYELNIMHPDERRLIKLLLDTSPQEKGDNLLEDHTTDLQIIDLYAGLGRLVDEKKPMVVRLWYCDIGVRGNVPNWTVREKLLDKFLLGGKPVPERVFEIVRMYKRMAEAGFLAKEPGMGAADIAKAHRR